MNFHNIININIQFLYHILHNTYGSEGGEDNA